MYSYECVCVCASSNCLRHTRAEANCEHHLLKRSLFFQGGNIVCSSLHYEEEQRLRTCSVAAFTSSRRTAWACHACAPGDRGLDTHAPPETDSTSLQCLTTRGKKTRGWVNQPRRPQRCCNAIRVKSMSLAPALSAELKTASSALTQRPSASGPSFPWTNFANRTGVHFQGFKLFISILNKRGP